MQQIFSQAIRFHPKGISSQHSGHRDDGSNFPDWEEKKLGGVGQIVTGGKLQSRIEQSILWNGNIQSSSLLLQRYFEKRYIKSIVKEQLLMKFWINIIRKLLPIGSIAFFKQG